MVEKSEGKATTPKAKKARNGVRVALSQSTVASVEAAVKQFSMLGLTRRKALALIVEKIAATSADLDAVKLYREVIERRLGLVE